MNQSELEALNGLTKHEGWQILLEQLDTSMEHHSPATLNTIEELYRAKGEMGVVQYLKNVPAFVKEALDAL